MAYEFGPNNCTYYQDYYDNNYKSFIDRLCRGVTIGRVSAAFVILLLLIGLPWNVLVIAVIIRRKLFCRPSVMLMLNLAVVNLFVCLFIMPFPIVLGILVKPSLVLVSSKLVGRICQTGVLLALLPAASIYTVALMAVDRVIYLKKPVTYCQIVTPWRMLFAIVCLWLLCTAISLPPLFGFGKVDYSPDIASCTIFPSSSSSPHTFFYFILLTLWMTVGTLVQLIGCGCIICITRKYLLKKFRKAVYSIRGHSERPNDQSDLLRTYNKNQLQLVKVFGAIFTASMLTVFPLVFLTFTEPFLGDNRIFTLQYLYPVAYISLLSKSVWHPILESYMTHETRKVISQYCLACVMRKCELCYCKKSHDELSSTEAGSTGMEMKEH